MVGRGAAGRIVVAVGLVAALAGCDARRLVRQYEYEEEMYLDLDGSATVTVNTSIAALKVLRGLDLDTRPTARVDRARLRRLFESPVTRVSRVSQPWRRDGRRFVQIRIEVDDVRSLSSAAPFEWSQYELQQAGEVVIYRQRVGAPASAEPFPGWSGSELVAFRIHLPSRIQYHNAPTRTVSRGNILEWEQPMADRLRGQPLELEARMEPQSILYSTLLIFGWAIAAAACLMAAAVYWVVRKGRASRSY
jgi:hypothetical protein